MNEYRKIHYLVMPVVAIGFLGLTACQSSSSTNSNSASESAQEFEAVACSKCKVTWVGKYDMSDPYMMTVKQEKVMICPDCQTAAKGYFKKRKLQDRCESCGGEIKVCVVDAPRSQFGGSFNN